MKRMVRILRRRRIVPRRCFLYQSVRLHSQPHMRLRTIVNIQVLLARGVWS
jgi:hypothetical protein